MKTFLRLFATSLFVGQFGSHAALAEPPRATPAGLFSDTSEEPDAVITLLDPRESDGSILLIDGQNRTRRPAGRKPWPWSSAKPHLPLLTGTPHQSAPSAKPASTPQPLDWKSQSEPGHDSKRRRAAH